MSRYDPLRPHWRETVAEYRAAARHARPSSPTFVIRWADGYTVAMSFLVDGRKPVEAQLSLGRRLCLEVRRYALADDRPHAGILVEYVREIAGPGQKAWERDASPADLAAGIGESFDLLSDPIWHRRPAAPPPALVYSAPMLEAAE